MADNNSNDQFESELKRKLSPEQFAVLRQKATEKPFSGKLLHNKQEGFYLCAACGSKLFKSTAKYDSGSGWPSFTDAIPDKIKTKEDLSHGMIRTEVLCAECNSHLGHLFTDGPQPGGNRYCINSLALDFSTDQENS